MTTKYLVALDAGTSSLRCLVFDQHGKLVSSCRREYIYRYPPEIAPLGREFDAKGLWQTACDCITGALKLANINLKNIAGVSTTSQREGAVFLDKKDQALYAGPNIDLRAVTEGLILDNNSAAEIHRITGHLPSLMFVPARLLWFRNSQPDIYQSISSVLSITNWLAFRLCGTKTAEICGAVEMGLADVAHRDYSPELFTTLDLPEDIFPGLVTAGTSLGCVTSSAAAETGIPEGTPVIQGAPDSHCGLIGLGLKEESQIGIISGWSTPLQLITSQALFDTDRRIWTGCHVAKDKWILESNTGESGHALQWVKEKLFGQDGLSAGFSLLDRLAMSAPAGADGVLAFTGPEAMDMGNLSLRWGGFIFPVPFSATHVESAQLARSALENIGFAIRINAEQIEGIAGEKINEVKFGGGLTRMQCLKQILPSILHCPVGFAAVEETSGLGAAILSAVGSGIYHNLDEALAAMQSPVEIAVPDRLMSVEYEEYYRKWLTVSHRLKEIGEALN